MGDKMKKTSREIIEKGKSLAPDEMCLSMKIYLGHIDYLERKCDYLLIFEFCFLSIISKERNR